MDVCTYGPLRGNYIYKRGSTGYQKILYNPADLARALVFPGGATDACTSGEKILPSGGSDETRCECRAGKIGARGPERIGRGPETVRRAGARGCGAGEIPRCAAVRTAAPGTRTGAHREAAPVGSGGCESPRVALNARGSAPLPDRRHSRPGERSKGLKVSQGDAARSRERPTTVAVGGTGLDCPKMAWRSKTRRDASVMTGAAYRMQTQ
ncbi:hypothetical protein NDU88_006554 [Pleurodeles waltl]|uniref:Uncharacterized protein n=1 Tax=Pleurodeles waltl TaxID=8319 RepID=A0AAV7NQN1_PLEWA|nr:hypothetical protein NDU88_006554 [Pleurodeles waltl]